MIQIQSLGGIPATHLVKAWRGGIEPPRPRFKAWVGGQLPPPIAYMFGKACRWYSHKDSNLAPQGKNLVHHTSMLWKLVRPSL